MTICTGVVTLTVLTLIYVYHPEAADQSSLYVKKGEPRPQKPRENHSKINIMLTALFDYCGTVHCELFSTGQTVNKEYYLSIITRTLFRLDWRNKSRIEKSIEGYTGKGLQ